MTKTLEVYFTDKQSRQYLQKLQVLLKSIIELQVLLPTVVVLAQQAPQYHIQVIYNRCNHI